MVDAQTTEENPTVNVDSYIINAKEKEENVVLNFMWLQTLSTISILEMALIQGRKRDNELVKSIHEGNKNTRSDTESAIIFIDKTP